MTTQDPIELRVGKRFAFQFQGHPNDLALFASLGGALAEVQSFELHVEMIIKALAPKSQSAAEELPQDELLYTKTLGALIKLLRTKLPDDELANALTNAKDKRNYMVHRILRSFGWPLMSDADYVRAIQEIEGIREAIESANLSLSRYLSDRSLLRVLVISVDRLTGDVKQVV